jgi:hypothetical protein
MMNMMLWLFLRRHLGTRVGPNRSEPTERLRRSVDAQPIGISRILLNPGVFLGRTCYRRGAPDAEGQSRNHTEREDRRQKNLGTEKFFCPQIFLSLFLLVGAATAGETHFFSIPDFRPLFA